MEAKRLRHHWKSSSSRTCGCCWGAARSLAQICGFRFYFLLSLACLSLPARSLCFGVWSYFLCEFQRFPAATASLPKILRFNLNLSHEVIVLAFVGAAEYRVCLCKFFEFFLRLAAQGIAWRFNQHAPNTALRCWEGATFLSPVPSREICLTASKCCKR